MKVAITIWNEHISPVFDVCKKMLILDIQDKKIISQREENFIDDDPLKKISQLSYFSIHTLICGAISKNLADELSSLNIKIIPFISGKIENVIFAYISDQLLESSFLMPGCRKRCQRRKRNCCKK